MLLFRDEEHIEEWCKDWKLARGATLTLNQSWRLAKAWYGPDRRQLEWSRKTVDETEALFADLGLSSPFWRLR